MVVGSNPVAVIQTLSFCLFVLYSLLLNPSHPLIMLLDSGQYKIFLSMNDVMCLLKYLFKEYL